MRVRQQMGQVSSDHGCRYREQVSRLQFLVTFLASVFSSAGFFTIPKIHDVVLNWQAHAQQIKLLLHGQRVWPSLLRRHVTRS